ncbi:uncharacterized protein LOC110094336 [Dendrobium catenatum]|uniref:rRNA methyltransferase YlbH n=1 Tax=Dendrobium catenatum TaxID=906689 RepID=A0A2I0WF60_9ASPA|nr:uncharacterized protein LOC110094336 [Dendrobium catenatum]PKU74295.1 hypothetical protein MA16_Dca003498 [Dendrobium catenatum]
MASASIDSSPLPTPSLRRRLHSLKAPANISLPSLPLSSSRCRTSLLIVCSSTNLNSKGTPASEEKRKILREKYGLDPNDFISQPNQRSRRRGAEEGRGKTPEVSHRTTHKLLQVLGGKARRKKLLSPKGMDVRPMMEVVRGAAFDILQVAGGCPASLRSGRWLDLYSGTGSVGIEAMSRGCSEAHFVEMDPWVISEVLRPNLEWTGFLDFSVIHTLRVENFLERAEMSLGKVEPFDYISVTPPYTAVNYCTLMEQLAKCPLVGEDCFILVEYPLKTSMAESCGHLVKIADRRFGRTNLLIYGPSWALKKRKSDRLLLD